jgi:hypothetical protein
VLLYLCISAPVGGESIRAGATSLPVSNGGRIDNGGRVDLTAGSFTFYFSVYNK